MVSIVLSLIPFQKVKASQIDATQKIHKLYDGYYYDFIPDDSVPVGYEFNSEVLDYVISQGGNFLNAWITQRYGKIINWAANSVYQGVFSLYRTLALANNFIVANLFDQDAYIYKWTYECTGIEETNTEYGAKYGFLFTGIVGEHLSICLNQNGNIWGSEPIGNITFNSDSEEIINQIAPNFDPNEIFIPVNTFGSLQDCRPPYFNGKELHFFLYDGNLIEHEYVIDDFTRCILGTGTYYEYMYEIWILPLDGIERHLYIDNQLISLSQTSPVKYQGPHYNGIFWGTGYRYNNIFNRVTNCNLPIFYGISPYQTYFNWYAPNCLGILNSSLVYGSGDIWLDSVSTSPSVNPPNPDPVPIDIPIPVTEIPSNPEDPIPQNPTPDPVPGIPVNPVPIPLPPFASIVSGNDELWGETLGFEEAQDGLLPYMTSLSEFSFPSFTDLISDFSGSIIWVAQIMSILYNGTSFNVLFIALCLFSLVSILIGAYKLWATTEPDPNNPGFRRSKRPPKPPKGRRRR